MSSSASSSSCPSKKAGSGRRRSSSRSQKSWPASAAFCPSCRCPPAKPSETARRYTFPDGAAKSASSPPSRQAFCGACSRVRLTSDGKIRTCLFSQTEHDLYGQLRAGASDQELRAFIFRTVQGKEARHHIGEPGFLKPSRSMVHIGG